VTGYTTCNSATSTDRCEQHDVRINNNVTDEYSTTNDRSLLCHELGHAIGLAHRNSQLSCMMNPNSEVTYYSSHDLNHINSADW
jgi:predicted Zn-dependent protease